MGTLLLTLGWTLEPLLPLLMVINHAQIQPKDIARISESEGDQIGKSVKVEGSINTQNNGSHSEHGVVQKVVNSH